ncbi:hypothetical protein JMJ77_0008988, partial [Colletotrichum scovillei]
HHTRTHAFDHCRWSAFHPSSQLLTDELSRPRPPPVDESPLCPTVWPIRTPAHLKPGRSDLC